MKGRFRHAAVAVAFSLFLLPAAEAAEKLSRPAGAEWPATGGDWSNSRFSTLKDLDRSTVRTLGAVWTVRFPAGEATRATPVVADGLMFVSTTGSVFAYDAATGRPVWTHKLAAGTSALYRGVALGEGMVFVGLANGRMLALRQKTGERVWEGLIGDDPPLRGQYVSKGPTYAEGLVISGLANGDYGIRGRVVALDARTGKQVWRFDTVPAPGEPGSETWPKSDAWKRGGGGVWNPPAIDAELGLVFFGTADPVPQWGGEAREGDNLYTNSVVALDLKTGKRRWHYQTVRHDIWDNGLGTPLVLYDAVVDGKPRKALAALRTDGHLFLLDRATGKPVHPVEERPVPQNARLKTAPTQPFSVGADSVGDRCVRQDMIPPGFLALCQFDPIDYDRPNAMYPLLSTRSSPMAYSPQATAFFATGAIKPFWLRRFEDPDFFIVNDAPGTRSHGVIAAIDARTNKLLWRKETPYEIQNGSGFLATAGGLLFHGEPDGFFQAYDASDGSILWRFQTGGDARGAASTFQAGGRQHVAMTAETSLWVFAPGGTLPEAPAPTPPPTESSFSGRVERADAVDLGATIRDFGLEVTRQVFDPYAIRPARIRVKAGTPVTWTNRGQTAQQVVADDGSWKTGTIAPGATATVTFGKPGIHTYAFKDHPWSRAQVIVE